MNEQNKPKLLDLVRDVIRRKHYGIRTEQSYIDWIRRFILFHQKRHPSKMRETEVNAFLTHSEVCTCHTRSHENILQPNTTGAGNTYFLRPVYLSTHAAAKRSVTTSLKVCCSPR